MEERIEGQEFSFREIWRILIKRRWIVLLVFSAVFLSAAVFTFLQKPIYRASATIQVEGPAAVQSIFNSFDQQMFNIRQYNSLLTEMQIIKSRSIAEEVVLRQRLNQQIVRDDERLGPLLKDAFILPIWYAISSGMRSVKEDV